MGSAANESGTLLQDGLNRYWSAEGRPEALRPRVRLLGMVDAAEAGIGSDGPGIFLTPRSALIGPVGAGEHGPCANCLASRWQRIRPPAEREVLEAGGSFFGGFSAPYLTDFVIDAVHHLYTKVIGGERPAVGNPRSAEVVELSLASLAVRSFPLLADSGCPRCACPVPATAEYGLAPLVSRRKPDPAGFRLRSAEDHDTDTAVFANPVCGVLGDGVHLDLTSPTMAPATGNMRVSAGGRLLEVGWSGQTDSYRKSRFSAAFEGLERHAGTQQRRHRELVVGSYREFTEKGTSVLDPRACGTYDDALYAVSDRLIPFDPDRDMTWVWGRSLRDDLPILVPEQLVYYVRDGSPGAFVDECSNGCAVGGVPEEAILHALLELVERDAFVLGWYGAVSLREIDVDSLRSPRTRHMVDRIRLHGYDVRLFDNRIDLPFPVVNAVGVRRDGGLGNLCFAAGSAMDPEGAVHSALSEIATYIPSLAMRADKRAGELRAMADDHRLVRELKDHPLLFALPEMAPAADFLLAKTRPESIENLYREWEVGRPRTMDLLEDLRFCVSVMERAGFDVIAVDQTSPEQKAVGLSNVCVIAPGLAPIDFGWGKQRVLTMPRFHDLLGRGAGRGRTGAPNPVPHPFP